MSLLPPIFLLSLLALCFAGEAPAADKDITEDLYKGKAKLDNKVTLLGEQNWENGDERGFAYYGYKYGKAGRFEHSVENTDFAYMEDPNRVKLGHACHQLPMHIPGIDLLSRNLTMDEDCLYLDVYLPPVKKDEEKKWPVLFWVYGGGFKIGDKDMYNASIFARAVDAIIVTVNYRVSVFGFFSTGDEAASGNYAIGDLKVAFKWTLDNIGKFNGDPAKITIFGESAGGALTSALMLDDHVRGKAFAAVAMSGSMMTPWTIRANPIVGAKKLAESFGCPTETSAGIVQCLKTQPVAALLNSSLHVLENGMDVIGMHYAPVIDSLHLPKQPAVILKERLTTPPKTPTATFITGFMTDDSAFFLITQPKILNSTFSLGTVANLTAGFVAAAPENKACPQNIPIKLKLILDHYNLTESSTPQELRKEFYRISTDIMFGLGSAAESQLYSGHVAANNQMYKISYDIGFQDMGAFHFLEILHLFRGQMDGFLKDKVSDTFSKSLYDYFRHIAHNGRATGPAFGKEGHYQELTQTGDWVVRQQDFNSILQFWKNVSALPCQTSTAATVV